MKAIEAARTRNNQPDAEDIAKTKRQEINKSVKEEVKQLDELSPELLNRAADGADNKMSIIARQPDISDALGTINTPDGRMNPLSYHYQQMKNNFLKGAKKASVRDQLKAVGMSAATQGKIPKLANMPPLQSPATTNVKEGAESGPSTAEMAGKAAKARSEAPAPGGGTAKNLSKAKTNEEIQWSDRELAHMRAVLGEAVAPTPDDYSGPKDGPSIRNLTDETKKPMAKKAMKEESELEEGRGKGAGRGRPAGAKSGANVLKAFEKLIGIVHNRALDASKSKTGVART
jgi:hypothetical protein